MKILLSLFGALFKLALAFFVLIIGLLSAAVVLVLFLAKKSNLLKAGPFNSSFHFSVNGKEMPTAADPSAIDVESEVLPPVNGPALTHSSLP
jgi:maltodextrin utilization protein YvdJ